MATENVAVSLPHTLLAIEIGNFRNYTLDTIAVAREEVRGVHMVVLYDLYCI